MWNKQASVHPETALFIPLRRVIIALCITGAVCMMVLPPALCWGLELHLPERAYQGDVIVGRVKPTARVFVKNKEVPVSALGYFAVGVPRDQKTDFAFKAAVGKKETAKNILVMAFPWKVQRIEGLQKRYVSPPPEAVKRIKRDNQTILAIRRSKGLATPLFVDDGFISPVKGPITGPFGSRRILNGRPRSPHGGVDFAAPKGAPVHSPAPGIVRLAATGMYLMGNVLMIDHGLGVRSIFIHLDRILVREGDRIEQGQRIALVGKTGRATGPHLHWGVSVGVTTVDPVRLGRSFE
ncbi:MAG: M23 family metallopeptidase [Deltaproteobacteria bacterium]|nr:M23 family metallopeptidase [Deltaproteobacteria bacterium]